MCGLGACDLGQPLQAGVQVDLRSDTRYRTCWVEPHVKVGDQITLENSDEPTRRWDVLRVGAARPASDIKRGWDNNI
jgi:hypothetical protein